jgi:outer membrane protein assembly factor BamB
MLRIGMCAIFFFSITCSLMSQEWSRFRGPNGSGVGTGSEIPTKWSEDDYVWNVEVPGIGHSSPVLWGDKIFITSALEKGEKRLILAYDANSGKQLWKVSYDSSTHKKHAKNSFASSSPCVDEDRVYISWATPKAISVLALSHDGKELWKKEYGEYKSGHGFGISPVVYQDVLLLGNDQDGKSSLLGINKTNGELIWETSRKSKRTTYSTPCIFQRDGAPPEAIFVNWVHGVTAVDPLTGEVKWEKSVFDQSSKERAIGSPIIVGDYIIATCGFVTAKKHVVAVRPNQKTGEVDELYRIEKAVPHIPTCLAVNGLVFLWSDPGIVTCIREKDGEEVWQKRIGGKYFGSPVSVNNAIYAIDESGEVVVLSASEKYEVLGKMKLDDACLTTPAIANGKMFIRSETRLMALGKK